MSQNDKEEARTFRRQKKNGFFRCGRIWVNKLVGEVGLLVIFVGSHVVEGSIKNYHIGGDQTQCKSILILWDVPFIVPYLGW